MLGFGVEIWVSKLKLRTVVRESLVIAHVKGPKNPRPGFPFIAKIQDGRLEIKHATPCVAIVLVWNVPTSYQKKTLKNIHRKLRILLIERLTFL